MPEQNLPGPGEGEEAWGYVKEKDGHRKILMREGERDRMGESGEVGRERKGRGWMNGIYCPGDCKYYKLPVIFKAGIWTLYKYCLFVLRSKDSDPREDGSEIIHL